ncbi:MAG TPA: hypothetical protein VNN07_16475, partial [Candidatus Tectomicrobia bacterium]|nr:hypothetical protein [Candidatus Tectomicrobia bacterium]
MSGKHPVCVDIEPDLIATATGEASAAAAARVAGHVSTCRACREEFADYRAVERELGTLRAARSHDEEAAGARERLLARLGDIESRLVRYTVFDSPLGPILLARSELGVALIEYLGAGGVQGSGLRRLGGARVLED